MGYPDVKWLGLLLACLASAAALGADAPTPPKIQSLLKPEVFQRVVQDHDIMDHASLEDQNGARQKGAQKYSYYAAMLVQASVRQTRAVLTDYPLYSKIISYIDKSQYDPATQILELSGGIFGWRLRSWVHFEEVNDRWIRYKIVRGNFVGMGGDILFEKQGLPGRPDETLVYLGGGLTATNWPPKLIIERGAEIVFGFTAKRMRSYINDQATQSGSHL